jgi:hypothetical protein
MNEPERNYPVIRIDKDSRTFYTDDYAFRHHEGATGVWMTKEEYQAIPATMDSCNFFKESV